jgi:hypothetical protein
MLTREQRRRETPEERHAARQERIAAQRPPPTMLRGSYSGTTAIPAPPALQKVPGKVQQAIRDSARGEECTVRLSGVCNSDPRTVVWSHYPGHAGDRGMATKSLDLCGCYACSACHDVVDLRMHGPAWMTRDDVMLAWHEGHIRSLVRLAQKGLL